ncbi:hypothetical protein Dsin_013224 [Dipteronia sinensis]|uniref:F-box domain-containing protein n=1 Tax=Dipteronia sinensis TaxID=43782 RepID=A0AAE0AKU5_9ROSI|nr:hypothetical protein Dsin_013223 [Dipteronia sinensis]KAK3219254.1 hypothetical protein Dsin_013224 [Dipteronia sinensis]
MEANTLDLVDRNQKTHKSEKAGENQNSDRISCLPDSIIYHILNFVPTIYVVQTSILSKRWKNIWISLPYIDFDDESVTDATGIEHSDDETLALRNKFRNSVNNFMLRRASSSTMSIIKFQLSTYCQFHGSHINEWISAAIRAGVLELDICIGNIENDLDYRLPSCLFNCKSLVTLKLCVDDVSFRFLDFFCFPNLKDMHLTHVILAKNFHHQLLNCPNLEKLHLDEFFIDMDPVLPSSNTFQDLTAERRSRILSNLDDAFIGMKCNHQSVGREVGRWLGTFIRKLSNVKTLRLSYASIKLLQYSQPCLLNHDHMPTFCNLKHLDLEVGGKDGDVVEILACLLQRSLDLQSLHLRYVFGSSWPRNWHGTLKPEEYLSNCDQHIRKLKKITVGNFWGTEKQIELVRLLLGNLRLEEITVQLHTTSYESLILLRQKLLQFPRLAKLVLLYETSEDEEDEEVIEEIFNVT